MVKQVEAYGVKERVFKALAYIEEHLDEELSLEDVAMVAAYSPFHFHCCFRGIVGESLGVYLRRLRLERAAQVLVYTARPVLDVALQAGYGSQEAFTRAFKTRFGVSPASYRKKGVDCFPRIGGISMNVEKNQLEKLGMAVTVKTFDPIEVAFVRHVGPYEECGKAWEALCGWAGPKGVLAQQPAFYGLSHDDPAVTEAGKIRYDACVSLPEGFSDASLPDGWNGTVGSSDVNTKTIAGGKYACAVLKGPYSLLAEAYAALYGEWLSESREALRDDVSCIEVYLNDATMTPAEELLTEIRIPLL